jgi:hypothetical protein
MEFNSPTGFGDASLDTQFYWRGLRTVHEWTKTGNWELMVRLRWADNDGTPTLRGKWGWRLYTGFRIGSEAEGFTFNVAAIKESENMPTGTDYLVTRPGSTGGEHNGMKFTTKDADNDWYGSNCATSYHNTGWWYNSCSYVTLNSVNFIRWHAGEWHHPTEAFMAIRQI